MLKIFTQSTCARPIAILAAAIIVAALGSLTTVWLRHKITHIATANRHLEESLQQAERKLHFLESKVAQAHQPEALTRKTQGILRPTEAKQIVWLENPVISPRAQIQKREKMLQEPLSISFDLAFLATAAQP